MSNNLNLNLNLKLCKQLSTFTINNYKETIINKRYYPINKCKEIIGDRTIGVIGYGPQGRGQALNLRDNGFNVVVGTRIGNSFDKALEDGWDKSNLLSIEEAVENSDIVQYLLSDVGQIKQWESIKPHLTKNKTLYFSHGFGITYSDKTNIIPPKDIDVVLVAPKGAGITVRSSFLEGKGINVSYAIEQDYTGNAKDTCMALAFGIGSSNAFETTFEKEVYSDLTGERCVLMGLIQGAFKAQYELLREKGHGPFEAYNETVEEALVSLYPLISEKGMDWLYSNCSTTAQRGALDWAPKFEKVLKPVIAECYEEVVNGNETDTIINSNSDINYREKLNKELKEMSDHELWKVAKIIRDFRC